MSYADVRWYAVHARPEQGSEERAKLNLDRQGYETFYPFELRMIKRNRREIEVRRPYFPRYLFVGVTPQLSIYPVDNTFGVSTVVRRGYLPFEIPWNVVSALRSRATDEGLMLQPKLPEIPLHRIGEIVRVLNGPFAGFMAEVARVDDCKEIQIFIDLFGRRTLARVNHGDVSAPAASACAVAVAA
jgi:transcriptional antiterminator RfaH